MFELKCLGKIFLLGEYACIEGGPALVSSIAPSYSLSVTKSEDAKTHFPVEIAPASPAGVFLLKNAKDFTGMKLKWNDPSAQTMGTGSSSAQFLLSVLALAKVKNLPEPKASEILEQYWKIVGESQGLRPSGLDLVAQFAGSTVIARNKPEVVFEKTRSWSAQKSGATFLLAFTGAKVKTHDHLVALKARGFPDKFSDCISKLNEITISGIAAWKQGNAEGFGAAMNAFQDELNASRIAPAEFAKNLSVLRELPGVLGCKGSGAQGGDCVLFLVQNAALENLKKILITEGFQPFSASFNE